MFMIIIGARSSVLIYPYVADGRLRFNDLSTHTFISGFFLVSHLSVIYIILFHSLFPHREKSMKNIKLDCREVFSVMGQQLANR